ncbi:MAG: hypothetical protein HY318_03490 [Armatimonadetes bacterium]|nr:hypothetical protein [Armatimonadota bacterium]
MIETDHSGGFHERTSPGIRRLTCPWHADATRQVPPHLRPAENLMVRYLIALLLTLPATAFPVGTETARVAEAVENLQKLKSLRFASREILRHGNSEIAHVETKGEWLVGRGLKVVETAWMGEHNLTTTTIVTGDMSYAQAGEDLRWTATRAKPEDMIPNIIADLPLLLRTVKRLRKGEDTLLRERACWSFEFTPDLTETMGLKADKAKGRLLIAKKSRTLSQITVNAQGADESKDSLSFSYEVDLFDFNEPLEIRPPVSQDQP